MVSINVQTGVITEVPDTIPLPTVAERKAEADAAASATAKHALDKIDVQSVRAMREFILAKFPG